jgi:hypothetical protein
MGPGTNPEDDKRKPEKGGKGDESGRPKEPGEGPLDLSRLGFKTTAGGDEPAGSAKPIKLPRTTSVPEDDLVDEDTPEEKAQRAALSEEARKLGIVPWDKSKMVQGPPATPDDIQTMFIFARGTIDRDSALRLEAKIRQYRNWYDAMSEVMDIVGKEIGEAYRRRN